MTKPIDELLEWLHTFDDMQFSCNHRNVIEKIWQIKSKEQCNIDSVSQQRELLIAFCKWYNQAIPSYETTEEEIVDTYLYNLKTIIKNENTLQQIKQKKPI